MEKKVKRKFVIIAKTAAGNFVKYRTNNIDKTIEFLIKKHEIFYCNVFSNKGINRGLMLYTYGRKKGLEPAHN
jgi:hypothetical protein